MTCCQEAGWTPAITGLFEIRTGSAGFMLMISTDTTATVKSTLMLFCSSIIRHQQISLHSLLTHILQNSFLIERKFLSDLLRELKTSEFELRRFA